jgi:hypothetical protein
MQSMQTNEMLILSGIASARLAFSKQNNGKSRLIQPNPA